MFSKVYGVGLRGIDGCLVQAETDIQDGLPSFVMVGALAPEVREAQDRVRTSLKNAGFRWRPGKVTINLSPAGLRKTGTGFDLPIAAGILLAEGLPAPDWLEEAVWIGELGLSGEVKPVRGILSMVLEARRQRKAFCILPDSRHPDSGNPPCPSAGGTAPMRQRGTAAAGAGGRLPGGSAAGSVCSGL